MTKLLTIEKAVKDIKTLIENAIKKNGVAGKNNLIRSQKPVCLLHDAAKASFINLGVNPRCIKPAYLDHTEEQKLAGFFKFKDQDICLIPSNMLPHEETLVSKGMLDGVVDPYGYDLTEKILSVNVRSQLSSISKNFDTLYERTFAEALNLHKRCGKMVLGEFYMIPVYAYDGKAAKKKEVKFLKNKNVSKHIEKYILSFNALNNRIPISNTDYRGEEFVYERVCLLIVDFRFDNPKIYSTNEELKRDGLLPQSTRASIDEMNFSSFASTLLSVYQDRFGKSNFK